MHKEGWDTCGLVLEIIRMMIGHNDLSISLIIIIKLVCEGEIEVILPVRKMNCGTRLLRFYRKNCPNLPLQKCTL